MSKTKLYGVYSQFIPAYEWPEELDSIWTDKKLAIKAALKLTKIYDYVWVEELAVNEESLVLENGEFYRIKNPKNNVDVDAEGNINEAQ